MNIAEAFSMAIKNIKSNKTRSILTMLGIIIGVAAVILITGLGNGMQNYMTESFESMGTNTLTVSIMGRGSKTMPYDDMQQLVDDNIDTFEYVSPDVSVNGVAKVGTETLDTTSIKGINEQYFSIYDYNISQGRAFQYMDMENRSHVCIVGPYVNKAYYGGQALGDTLKINGNTYTIVGVLNEEAESEESTTDDSIYLPYSTVSRLSGNGIISSYTVSFRDTDHASEAKNLLDKELYKYFKDDDAYMIISLSEMLDMLTDMQNIMITILTGIAAISLLVGGIGIMNIMLVSVTERTKEIGIRKALGAKEKTILTQFVIEAAMTSAIGGIIGIIFGYIFSGVATELIVQILQESITVVPTITAVLTAFGISAGIGVFFGYMPAKKAAKLNPIDALRYD